MDQSTPETEAPRSDAPIRYDLIVIGSGSGNTLIDERWASRRVALIDHGTFGGTCLNVGCIPTKMFVYPADTARAAERLPQLGMDAHVGPAHWAELRDRIFGRIDPISAGGLRYREDLPYVDVYQDTASFIGPKTLRVGRLTLYGEQIVIATGSHAVTPDVPGVDEVSSRLHTSDSIMRLERLPKSLIIVGGGFIAAEFAHVFATFGTHVTIINRSGLLLRREDRDIAERFTAAMRERPHVTVKLRQQVSGFEQTPHGVVVLATDTDGEEYEYEASLVLNAMGRQPSTDGLNAAAAGVELDDAGFVTVDEFQRTTADGIWALGDVCQPAMLKHVANAEARTVQHNLWHPEALRSSHIGPIPHAVFSDPEIAAVGKTEQQCREEGIDCTTAIQRFSDVAYGWAMEDSPDHIVKVIADPNTLQLLGAHIIGPQAAILIQPLIQAMSQGLDAHTMARGQFWIHPALAEVVENALLKLGRRTSVA